MYEENFDFAVGGKICCFGGGTQYVGQKPPGDGWSCYWLFDVSGAINLYTYHMDQEREWGDNWYVSDKKPIFKPGTWYRLAGHVKLNTGNNRDGLYEFYVNGDKKWTKRGIRFRNDKRAPASSYSLAAFYGGQGDMFKAKRDSHIYYDDIRADTKPDLIVDPLAPAGGKTSREAPRSQGAGEPPDKGDSGHAVAPAAAPAPDVPQPQPKIADKAWADVLHAHPRLYGSKARLQALAKANPELYRRAAASPSLPAVGVVHAVAGADRAKIDAFVKAALATAARGPTNQHQDTWIALRDAVLTYDFFHEEIPAADRQKLVDWINAHLETFTADENAFHNSTLSKILTYLQIAYATWGENPKAQAFRDRALTQLYEGKVVPVLREFGAGGGFTEGGWYSRGSLWNLVEALELARRIEGYDGFQQAPRFFYERLAYEMFQPYPGLWTYGTEQYPEEGDGSHVYGGHTEYPRHLRTVLAQYFRGSELARAIANRQRRASNPEAALVDLLYAEAPDPALDLKRFPLAHLAAGIGKVYARSDWTADATWFRFDCGDYWSAHQHFEVGNFEIYRYEPLATESGEYHDWGSSHAMNWLIRTVAHNCVLVYQPGETWTNMRDGGRVPYANDGGQAKKWDWTVDTLDQWQARREQFHRGDLVAYQNRPEYLYVAGDCTKAYAPAKLALWQRQIVFLRPATFVVFDRVVSTKPEFEKTWLLHCRQEPEIKDQTVTIANGKGRLVVQTLLPEKPLLRKVQGYTYHGQTFDPPATVLSETANKWRLELLPTTAQKEDVFLNVLFTDEPKPASLVRRAGQIGVRVGDAEVSFDTTLGGTLTVGATQYPLKPEVVKGKYE